VQNNTGTQFHMNTAVSYWQKSKTFFVNNIFQTVACSSNTLHTPNNSCNYFSQVFKPHLMAAALQIAHETEIRCNMDNSSNWGSRITRQSHYKCIYLLHRIPSTQYYSATQLGYRFRFDINHREDSSLGKMVLKEEASWWFISSRNM
jgi:hypothetical protein